ncbi:oxidoreductase [Mycolicibacterium chitae]|uniref:Propionate 3-nitronate monooxygenase n=1 Tax=Mycolicibacterium chitae TaxID=1792 RepID=A0A448I7Z0_MYCCI|nr:nitronate monooxygenase [Mycolicibacterium chitae]MCV7105221.1 nitronate monooxygenase [Mycolicibacterium chitae]BBZ05009.1 oxidoreductase [Mycolicibacterium chitae]VEG48631.1 Nitronate monooxygenase [Mycolicibacterium chitae]
MSFALADLAVPLIGAPMAGGPGTPALATAVSGAGGLGFLAAGYRSAQQVSEDLRAVRSAGAGPVGLNLFVPQPSTADPAEIDRYRAELATVAARYGVELGVPRWDDDGWTDKLEVVADLRPEVVSFTFALPDRAVLQRLSELGICTLMTVTTVAEARAAVAGGAAGLVVQGPEAGGHRGSWRPDERPATQPLGDLVAAVRHVVDVPIVAAGGLGTPETVAAVLARGADAAQLGTALLLSDEAGTNAVHRAALSCGEPSETAVTRAFSGRYARGLHNAFVDRFDAVAPGGYPEVHHLAAPLRRAAVAAGDPDWTNLWAGTAFAAAEAGPAAAVIAALTP